MVDQEDPNPLPMTHTEGEGETQDFPEGVRMFTPGQVLGDRYQILEMLGRGGIGEVWHAFDLKLRVEVALKALREDFIKNERRLELLRQEVRAAREVMSPNVCRIFDLIEAEGRELVSMEYIDGATLLEVLQDRGPLELKDAQEIASQFLAGLESIHQVGLVHRDVKPENIMLTRAGRVVVMDFGLARQEDSGAGTVAGTPAYMAPEQAAGLKVDARADVYSAGVVLAEMVSPDGIKSYESRQSLWEAVRSEPAKVPDTPWAPVVKKAVAKEREQRYNSAHTLIRALEDRTFRVEGAEDLHPYPGLASFTEEDAEYFFGREAEIEQMWRRLEGPARLLGLVGPSGAGKTSFIRAGLVPHAGAEWQHLICKPGDNPELALSRALASEFAGDAEAVDLLLRFHDPAVAVEAVSRWRAKADHAVLVVDQFEELFTQNPAGGQRRFAELLSRFVLESDVHVLLSMRDDFLLRCHDQEDLASLFSDLTPLGPPAGAALRRALVQPAMKCGYRFEDDELVDEMLTEVEGERGALPLLAFAMSRLWEKRDRENGLLTRHAYHDIGGVGGALARHAETTLEHIGTERTPVVRELFRNLVTAEGTRAVRGWNELLSVFEESQREPAEKVLRELIDARLLTSYEIHEEDQEPSRRVEIIHESLLAAWPRLVRWQTQDQEGAQLRDELRQAARSWDEHGRHDDRLWTGTAFREYQLWRERYPGSLSQTEEAFATAMASLATRRKRRRRTAFAAGIAALLAVLAVVTVLWQRSLRETRRAEASKLLALGEIEIDTYPTAALAWATASMQLSDTLEGRLLALRALHRGPPVTVLPNTLDRQYSPMGLAFSPSGGWLAAGWKKTAIWPQIGGDPIPVAVGAVFAGNFLAENLLVTNADSDNPRYWSIPDGVELVNGRETPGWVRGARGDGFFTYSQADDLEWLHWWPLNGGRGRRIGGMEVWKWYADDIDSSGLWLAYSRGQTVFIRSLEDWSQPPLVLAEHNSEVEVVTIDPDGEHVAALDSSGLIGIWPTAGRSDHPVRTLQTRGSIGVMNLRYDPRGTRIAIHATVKGLPTVSYWDLTAPQGAAPITLLRSEANYANPGSLAWHPSGSWLVHATSSDVGFWPVSDNTPVVLEHGGRVMDLIFTPDGSWLITASSPGETQPLGQVRAWPLKGQNHDAPRVLLEADAIFYQPRLAVDPSGEHVAVHGGGSRVGILPIAGGTPRVLAGGSWSAFSPDGRFLATAPSVGEEGGDPVRLWDLDSEEERVVGHVRGLTIDLRFLDEHRLLWAGSVFEGVGGGEMVFDLQEGAIEILSEGGSDLARVVSPDGTSMFRAKGTGPEDVEFFWSDLETGESHSLENNHGNPYAGAIDPSGKWVVTGGDQDGIVRVGPVTGEAPHHLYGHKGRVREVAFSPDGRWIASCGYDNTARLWPMPDMTKPPLHTLSHGELIAKLRTLTNLRAVRDEESSTGWKIEVGPFPGWEKVPTW